MSRLVRERYPLTSVRLANERDLYYLFSTAHLSSDLFPDGIFITGFDVCDAKPENVQYLVRGERCYVIALDKESFSSGEVFRCPAGLLLLVVMYGRMTSQMAVSHLLQYFPLALQHYRGGRISLLVSVPSNLSTEELWQACSWLPFVTHERIEGPLEVVSVTEMCLSEPIPIGGKL